MTERNDTLNLEWVQSELNRIGFTEDTDYANAVKQLLACIHDMAPARKEIRKDLLQYIDMLHAALPLTELTEDDELYEDNSGMKRFVRCPQVFQNPSEDNKYFDDYAITFKGDDGNFYWTEKSTREIKLPYKVTTKIIRM